MREILFRGKRRATGEWVEGFYVSLQLVHYEHKEQLITDKDTGKSYEVDLATVGQYTGLKDKNGKRIFEGDILLFEDGPDGDSMAWCQGEVRFDEGAFYVTDRVYGDMSDFIYDGVFDGTVIGNIHDNPELFGDDRRKEGDSIC